MLDAMAFLRPLARAARAATTGAPRLYVAARGAGADRAQALAAVRVSAVTLATTLALAARRPREWRRSNAVRHFCWQALLAARHGPAVADALAQAHERGSGDPADSAVDRANNAAGQRYAAEHGAELRRLPLRRALLHLARVADVEWAAGRLSAQPRRAG